VSDSFSIVERETLLTSHVFSIQRRTVAHQDTQFQRDVAVHPGAVAMVAINDLGQVGLVRQYRAAVNEVLWEIPAGTIDVSDADPLATAQRELREELGVAARDWKKIIEVYVSPGWTTQIMHIFEARSLNDVGRLPDGPEESAAQVVWLGPEEVRTLLDAGEIHDATSTIGLHHFLGVNDHR
jgi:ADP-ribose pyrophosphatase